MTMKINWLHQHWKGYNLQKARVAWLPIVMTTLLRVYPKYFFTDGTTSKFSNKFLGYMSYQKKINMYPVLKLRFSALLFTESENKSCFAPLFPFLPSKSSHLGNYKKWWNDLIIFEILEPFKIFIFLFITIYENT